MEFSNIFHGLNISMFKHVPALNIHELKVGEAAAILIVSWLTMLWQVTDGVE